MTLWKAARASIVLPTALPIAWPMMTHFGARTKCRSPPDIMGGDALGLATADKVIDLQASTRRPRIPRPRPFPIAYNRAGFRWSGHPGPRAHSTTARKRRRLLLLPPHRRLQQGGSLVGA